MRIDRIDLYHVAMPLISPWRTAYGEDAVIESVLVKLTSGAAHGWGETCPLAAPCYSPEWAGGVFATLRNWLAPHAVGLEYTTAADGPGGVLLVREYVSTGTASDVRGVKLTGGANLTAGAPFVVSAASNSETDAATAWNGSTYFSVWLDTREANQTLWGAPISVDGTPGTAVRLFANPVDGRTYRTMSPPRIASPGSRSLTEASRRGRSAPRNGRRSRSTSRSSRATRSTPTTARTRS